MTYIKNIVNKSISIFLLLILLSNNVQVLAKTKENYINELNIVIEGLENNKEKVDLKVHLYYIKKLENLDNMIFEPTEEFIKINEIDKKWEENSEEYVNEVKKYATDNNIKPTIDVDKKYINQMTFNNLDLGKYLVVIDDFILNDKKYECNSFIVSIPKKDGKDDKDFNIMANPKISGIEDDKKDEETNKPGDSETDFPKQENTQNNNGENSSIIVTENNTLKSNKKKLPDTGIPILLIMILSISGLILIIIGCILDRKKQK